MSEEIRPAPPAGVTDHGALTGLADDDHPQYADDAHSHAATDSSKASASSDLTATTGSAVDVTGATLSLTAGTYIVIGNFDVSIKSDTDRLFEGVLDVGGVDENDLAVLQGVGLDTDDRGQALQVWRIVLGSTTTVKLQARHSGGTTGDFTVNAANTTLTAYVAGGTATVKAVRVTRNAALNVTSTPTAVTWDNEVRDDGGFWTSGAATRITFPDTAWYMFGASISCGGTNNDYMTGSLRLNGTTTIAQSIEVQTVNGFGKTESVATLYYFTAGDYVELMIDASGTQALAVGPLVNIWAMKVG